MSVNGTLVEDKVRRFKGECAQFSLNKCSVPFTLTTVQVPYLALSHTKRITVQSVYPIVLCVVYTITTVWVDAGIEYMKLPYPTV